jgi:hypothetical protein
MFGENGRDRTSTNGPHCFRIDSQKKVGGRQIDCPPVCGIYGHFRHYVSTAIEVGCENLAHLLGRDDYGG